jgi:hypothetical protein
MRLLILALAVLALPASAETFSYDHNGSLMELETRPGGQVTLRYVEPRQGLGPVGVSPGTVLFDGTIDGPESLSGQANIFSTRCGPVDYYVTGQFRAGDRFVLEGAAPVLAEQDCRIVDHVWDNGNARLEFTPVGAGRATDDTSIAHRYCASPGGADLRSGPGAGFPAIAHIAGGACDVQGVRWREADWVLTESAAGLGWVDLGGLRAVE